MRLTRPAAPALASDSGRVSRLDGNASAHRAAAIGVYEELEHALGAASGATGQRGARARTSRFWASKTAMSLQRYQGNSHLAETGPQIFKIDDHSVTFFRSF